LLTKPATAAAVPKSMSTCPPMTSVIAGPAPLYGTCVISTFASTGMNQPTGVAFDGAGNLYVANYQTQNILKFTIGGVRSVFAPTLMGHPTDLAFDAAGNLYAASTPYNDPDGGGIIEKFTPAGAGSIFASGLDAIHGLAFDISGNLFVSNGNYYGTADSTVLKLAISGEKSVFANFGTSFPQGLAFDSTGNLYVANNGNGVGSNKVTKITPEGVASTFVTLANADLPRYLAFTDDAGQRLLIPPAVPEPSSAALIVAGALLLACRRSLRRTNGQALSPHD